MLILITTLMQINVGSHFGSRAQRMQPAPVPDAAAAAACLALARAPGALAKGCASVTCNSITDSFGTPVTCLWGTKPMSMSSMSYECSNLPSCFRDHRGGETVSVVCVCKSKSEAEEVVKEEVEPWLYLSMALMVLGGFIVAVMGCRGDAAGFLTSNYWLEYYDAPHKVGSSREPEVVEAEVVGVAAPWQSGEDNPNLAADGEANPNLVADLEANPNLVAGGAKNPPAPSSKVQAEGPPAPPLRRQGGDGRGPPPPGSPATACLLLGLRSVEVGGWHHG